MEDIEIGKWVKLDRLKRERSSTFRIAHGGLAQTVNGCEMPEIQVPEAVINLRYATTVLSVIGISALVLCGWGIWYLVEFQSDVQAAEKAMNEVIIQEILASRYSQNGWWVMLPSVVLLSALVYKCYKMNGDHGQRQYDENVRTVMIVGAIFATFGVFLIVKPYVFPEKNPGPGEGRSQQRTNFLSFLWSELGDNKMFGMAVILLATALGGYAIALNDRRGQRQGNENHQQIHQG